MNLKSFYLALTLFATGTLSGHAFTVGGLNYSVASDIATVTGASDKNITSLTIPATVTYNGKTYPVNYIQGNAFQNCSKLKELTIEDATTYIASDLYTLPNGLTAFGQPFAGCPIEKAYVGRNVAERLGDGYRADMTSITTTADAIDVTLGGETTFIPNLLFRTSPKLRSVTIGGKVKTIYSDAFKKCTGLKKVVFLNGEDDLTYTGGDTTFEGCSLDSIIVRRNLSQAYFHDFATLVISPEVTQINSGAFFDYNKAPRQEVIIQEGTADLFIESGVLRNNPIDSLYIGRPVSDYGVFRSASCKSVEFGPVVTVIPPDAFNGQQSLTSVTFSDNVTEIGSIAFSGCPSLTKVNVPASLKKIGYSAFSGCNSLSEFYLNYGLEIIGDNAFSGTLIDSWIVPASVKEIEGNALRPVSGQIKQIIFEETDTEIKLAWSIANDCVIDFLYIGRPVNDYNAFRTYGASCKSVEFGPVVTVIPPDAFNSQQSLTSVAFSEGVTEIGNNAFSSCPSLTEINVPAGLKKIGYSAFYGCNSLTEFYLNDGLEIIGENAFNGTLIDSWIVPASVKEIGGDAFKSESGKIRSIILSDTDVELMLSNTVSYCTVDSLYIGRPVNDYNAFRTWGAAYKSVEFGPVITVIPEYAFSGQMQLAAVTVGENVANIGGMAFLGCDNIQIVETKSVTPPLMASKDVFSDVTYANAKLIVPDNSVEAYKAAEYWKEFFKIESVGLDEILSDYDIRVEMVNGCININGNSEGHLVRIYDTMGRLIESSNDETITVDAIGGIYIIKIGNNKVMKVRV